MTIRNPFLVSIHNPELAILRLCGSRMQTEHIRARMRLRYSQADELLRRKDLGDDLCLELGRAEVQDGREADDFAAQETISISARAAAHNLLRDDELVEVVELCMCST